MYIDIYDYYISAPNTKFLHTHTHPDTFFTTQLVSN